MGEKPDAVTNLWAIKEANTLTHTHCLRVLISSVLPGRLAPPPLGVAEASSYRGDPGTL